MLRQLAVVDNNRAIQETVRHFFYDESANVDVSTYDDADAFLKTYEETVEDIVLLDFDTLNGNALKIIYGVEKINPNAIILLMSNEEKEDSEICISKPFKDLNNFAKNIENRVKKLSSDALKRGFKLDMVVSLLQTRKSEKKCRMEI
jgi:DNA-binding NtrC family response regulator